MSAITEFFKSIFSGQDKSADIYPEPEIVTFDDALEYYQFIINKVVNDIVSGFLEHKAKEHLLLELIDPVACNDVTLFLADKLEEQFDKYPVADTNIAISKQKTSKPCTNRESCARVVNEQILHVVGDKKVTKGDLCTVLASHYIKILNLLGALLVGISPEKNMYIERFNALYKLTTTELGDQAFEISICTPTGRKTTKSRLLEENGMRELINLYILDQLDKIKTPKDIQQYEADFRELITKLNDSALLTKKLYMPGETGPKPGAVQPRNIHNSPPTNIPQFIQTAEPVPAPTPDITKNSSSSSSSVGTRDSNRYVSYESSSTGKSSSSNRNTRGIGSKNSRSSNNPSSSSSSRNNSSSSSSSSSNNSSSSSSSSNNSSSSSSSLSGGAPSYVSPDKQDSIFKFLDFIRRYRQYLTPEVKQYFNALINNTFNGEPGYINQICSVSGANNKPLVIPVDDVRDNITLKDYMANFDTMKRNYFDNCNLIIDFIKTDILETNQEGKKITYSLKQISMEKLNTLQRNCRSLLTDMYIQCHADYTNGLRILNKYYSQQAMEKIKPQHTNTPEY
jgi:hypothetical protein